MTPRQIIKPIDCVVGFAIPHNKKSFYKNLRSGVNIDFTTQILWPCYEIDTIRPAAPIFEYIAALGVKIQYEYTFENFRTFFQGDDRHKLLVLFAHWQQDQIEFYNGLKDIDILQKAIPLDSHLILDLNVCTCDNFCTLLAKEHHFLSFRSNRRRLCYPIFWLRYYKYFFQFLNDYNATYNEATEHCITTFFNYIQYENN